MPHLGTTIMLRALGRELGSSRSKRRPGRDIVPLPAADAASDEPGHPAPAAPVPGLVLAPTPRPVLPIAGTSRRRAAPERGHRDPPGAWAMAAKSVGLVLLAGALVYGPPYHTCKRMKEHGMLYYGTTVQTCLREKVSSKYQAADAFLEGVLARR